MMHLIVPGRDEVVIVPEHALCLVIKDVVFAEMSDELDDLVPGHPVKHTQLAVLKKAVDCVVIVSDVLFIAFCFRCVSINGDGHGLYRSRRLFIFSIKTSLLVGWLFSSGSFHCARDPPLIFSGALLASTLFSSCSSIWTSSSSRANS